MSKPEDIPQDIWDEATKRAGGEFAYTEVVKCVARAILAERERCVAAVKSSAIPHYMALGTVNSILHKIDPALPAVEFTYPEMPTVRFVLREPE